MKIPSDNNGSPAEEVVTMRSLSLCCAALTALSFAPRALGDTHEVPAEFPTIQAAIDASVDGDVVLVSPGTYEERIRFGGREIEVRSTDGPLVTIIDGGQGGSVVRMLQGEGPGALLEGFTIQNGTGRLKGTRRFGGGIIASGASPTIRNNRIVNNVAQVGGGGAFGGGAPILENNEIVMNDADPTSAKLLMQGAGLAFFDSQPTLIGNLIDSNFLRSSGISDGGPGFGAGIYGKRVVDPLIEGNRIVDNTTSSIQTFGGGGIYLENTIGTAVIRSNEISGNSICGNGGGIYVVDSDSWIDGNRILGNFSDCAKSGGGGGIAVEGGSCVILNTFLGSNSSYMGGGVSIALDADVTLVGCTLSDNLACFGSGLSGTSTDTIVTNCTLIDNTLCNLFGSESGGAFTGDATVTNSIVRGNASPVFNGSPTFAFSNVEGGSGGSGNIDQHVQFADAPDLLPQLTLLSPGVDLGDPLAPGLSLTPTDADGDDRSLDGDGDSVARVDMGADELNPSVAVLFGNGFLGGRRLSNSILINESPGNRNRRVHVAGGDRIEVKLRHLGESFASSVIHANLGTPSPATLAALPAQIGTVGFPLVLPLATPVIIWNNLGRRSELGSSVYFGTPIADPVPEFNTTPLIDLTEGDEMNLPPGTTVTFQGIIENRDSISPKEISVTNGVVLVVE